jgi:hypothetical protein
MEIVYLVRLMLRRRIALAVGATVAVTLGALTGGFLPVGGRGSAPRGGVAMARVFIDTSKPLVASTTPLIADTIMQRTYLLADLMGTEPMTAQIAQHSGIRAAELAVVGPSFAPVSVNTLLPDGEMPQYASVAAQTAVYDPNVVRLTADGSVPIILIGAWAPDQAHALALAQATIDTLKSAAAAQDAGNATMTVQPLGPAQAGKLSAGKTRHLVGGVVAIVVFAAWCTGILLAGAAARVWRRPGLRTA